MVWDERSPIRGPEQHLPALEYGGLAVGRSEINEASVEASHNVLVRAKVSERLIVPKSLKETKSEVPAT
ncbi:MAG TPA: hypothetical protein VLH35_03190 [Candidatus Acidoferrales bacterium]|nr:hypothetical protein [Candidatus Acidoferrales bacterium]